jgi:hypothetical protein
MKDKLGSNSFSAEPRNVNSPEIVTTPPNGYPGGGQDSIL